MVQGRTLTDEPADAQAIVINEAAAKHDGMGGAIGQDGSNFWVKILRVVGVIEDFHFDGPR